MHRILFKINLKFKCETLTYKIVEDTHGKYALYMLMQKYLIYNVKNIPHKIVKWLFDIILSPEREKVKGMKNIC